MKYLPMNEYYEQTAALFMLADEAQPGYRPVPETPNAPSTAFDEAAEALRAFSPQSDPELPRTVARAVALHFDVRGVDQVTCLAECRAWLDTLEDPAPEAWLAYLAAAIGEHDENVSDPRQWKTDTRYPHDALREAVLEACERVREDADPLDRTIRETRRRLRPVEARRFARTEHPWPEPPPAGPLPPRRERARDAPAIGLPATTAGGAGFTSRPDPGRPVCLPRDGHLMTFGATGSGKTSGQIVPMLLDYEGPIVVVDPKGEAYRASAARRRRLGQAVWRIDPFATLETGPGDALNPLDATDPRRVASEAKRLARLLVPHAPEGKHDPFWRTSAEDILAAALAWTIADRTGAGRTVSEAAELGTLEQPRSAAVSLRVQRRSTSRYARQAIAQLHEADPPDGGSANATGASMRMSYRQLVAWLADPAIARTLARTTIDLERVVHGEGFTLYVTVPPELISQQAGFVRTVLGTLMGVMMRRRSAPRHATLFLVDEAASLGEMEEVRTLTTLMRGYSVQLWTCWQGVEQLARLYSDWRTLVANTEVITWLGGTHGGQTEEMMQLLGPAFAPGTDPERLRTDEAIVARRGHPARRVRLPLYFREPTLAAAARPREDHTLTR